MTMRAARQISNAWNISELDVGVSVRGTCRKKTKPTKAIETREIHALFSRKDIDELSRILDMVSSILYMSNLARNCVADVGIRSGSAS